MVKNPNNLSEIEVVWVCPLLGMGMGFADSGLSRVWHLCGLRLDRYVAFSMATIHRHIQDVLYPGDTSPRSSDSMELILNNHPNIDVVGAYSHLLLTQDF